MDPLLLNATVSAAYCAMQAASSLEKFNTNVAEFHGTDRRRRLQCGPRHHGGGHTVPTGQQRCKPIATGVAVSCSDATTEVRAPARWHQWPRDVRLWIATLFDNNLLRLKKQVWLERCSTFADWDFLHYVLWHGLSVTHPHQRPAPFALRNYSSVYDTSLHRAVTEVIEGEIRDGLIAHPPPWLLPHCKWVHPLAAIPKAGGKARVIHDFSAPSGGSLNDHIDFVSHSLPRHEEVFMALKPGMYMAKVDLTAFFRHIPLDPADWCLMSFEWEG